MIEIRKDNNETAILVGLKTKDISREAINEHITELEELASTAGAVTQFKIIQEKATKDSAYFIGKGKAEEIAQIAETNNIDIIIFDDDLSAVQIRNLERLINKKIIDRSTLILDIFAKRARTNEAKTQVELAQLQYLLPRLTRAWTHLSKQYGGIGTKGPGETQIETDRRIVRDRISILKQKLNKIEEQRVTQSQLRSNIITVALVGYTNAGKSTLFNLLAKENVFAEDKLFATLDSTTRSIQLDKNKKILISDTVGFIRKLPAHLVASFKSTLNEVRDAEIILHLIDVTHPYFEDHIKVVEDTLKFLNCENKKQLKVFNKIDMLEDRSKIEFILNKYSNSIMISALRGINVQSLIAKLKQLFDEDFIIEKIKIDLNNSKKISRIYELAEVISVKYTNKNIILTYKTNKNNAEKIKRIIQ